MTRAEFLEELRIALQGNISQTQVNENLRYYENYIIEESRKGKTEEQVISELGNPRLIARTIIDTSEQMGNAYDESYYTEEETGQTQKGFSMDQDEKGRWNIRYGKLRLNSWYIILLVILVLILFLVIVGHVVVFLLPVIGFFICLWIIIRLISGTKR